MQDIILEKPIFIVSIDLELAWGFILHPENRILKLLQSDIPKAKRTIDRLLNLLSMYDIQSTWAVTGHLLLEPEEGKIFNNASMPQFKEGWLDWDTYSEISNKPLYNGKELVEKILSSSTKHEIGLHSFFHLPFSSCSHTVADAEIQQGIQIANKLGVSFKSFVFPENKIGHLDVLKNHGFQIYRSKDATRYANNMIFPVRKLAGAIDKIIAPPVFPSFHNGMWEIPGSIYYFDPQTPFALFPRAKLGLMRAIRSKKVFHIWLHPWNLLLYESLEKDLESLLRIAAEHRDAGNIQNLTMGKLAEYLTCYRSKDK